MKLNNNKKSVKISRSLFMLYAVMVCEMCIRDRSQCESVNTALKQLRQEERLCRKIAEHSIEVQQHLTEARRDRAEQQQREQEHERDRRPNIDLTL